LSLVWVVKKWTTWFVLGTDFEINYALGLQRAPKKAVDFLSDKPIEIELEGELLALDGEDTPFYVDRSETG